MTNHYPFELEPLPYDYSDLEPYIDQKTMHLHHDRHLFGYVNNLNAALENYPQFHDWNLAQLLYYSQDLPEEIRTAVQNNGGGVFNHVFFFANLLSPRESRNEDFMKSHDDEPFLRAISQTFGSFEAFKEQFKQYALSVFGSGYTALVVDSEGNLKIINLKNQETTLSHNVCLIMLLDVWEHAYYLKHNNKRADYIDDFFAVVNLDLATKNYLECTREISN